MNNKKIIAMLTVLVMVIGSLTCVMATSSTDTSGNLDDEGAVLLDASKDFNSNKDDLNKLGITDPSDWLKTSSSTTLTLENVIYATAEAHAIVIYGECANFNMVVKGHNEITCGVNKVSTMKHVDTIYVGKDVRMITISGDGTLVIGVDSKLTTDGGRSALYVTNALTISGCTVVAHGPTVYQSESKDGDYRSTGIITKNGNVLLKNAKVSATGGDVFTKGECVVDETKKSAKSFGLSVGTTMSGATFTMINSILYAFGGDVESQAPGFYQREGNRNVDVESTGIFASGAVKLNNSVLRGYGGGVNGNYTSETVKANKHVSSEGMKFNDDIIAEKSIIFMVGGKAISSGYAASSGMRHFSLLGETKTAKDLTISLSNSDIYAYGGIAEGVAAVGKSDSGGSFGLLASEVGTNGAKFNLSIDLDGSVSCFAGKKNSYSNSVGVRMLGDRLDGSEPLTVGTISVDNSELYATGNTRAIIVKNIGYDGENYKFCKASTKYNDDGSDVDPKQLLGNYKSCAFGYNYTLFAFSYYTIYAPVITYDFSNPKIVLPAYELNFTPEGKKFKCWSIDGKEYRPGQVVDLTVDGNIAVAVWVDDNGSADTGNTLLWIAIVFIIIIAIALLTLVLIYSRPKTVAAPETKPVAKKTAKPKSTAKKTTAKKVSKPKVAKKTSKAKSKK